MARDSAASGAEATIGISPTTDAGAYVVALELQGVPNDVFRSETGVCPCNADGDIYYQVVATGAGTLDAFLQIWGYWL
jgi:hypothetical protein